MTTLFLIAQWAVSLVGVAFYAVLIGEVAREYGWWAIAFVLFPPALVLVYVPTRWARCWRPFLLFVACFTAAMLVQRARLGFWAWPDVGRFV